jgi:insulysin
MDDRLKFFDIDLPINDKRECRGIILENGINIVLISDSKIKKSSCSVAVHAGYLEDTFEGTAHFLEHLLFMGSKKFPEQNMYHSYIQNNGGIDNAFTGDNITCYFLELESEFLEKGIEMLSWFFREPLLDMKHIKSEMEIIHSEHQKNILSDMWIIDDIFKKFIIDSKYSNFGTGNMDSLKDITKEDIMNFYNTYYTTDNLFVCIVDTIDLKTMIHKYLHFFSDIPTKKYSNKIDRFPKINLKTIDDNLIVFKSISQYNFLNYYIIFDYDETSHLDFQLLNFISYLIGTEYSNSLSYYLKESEIITSFRVNMEYFYDCETVLYMNMMLSNDDIDNIQKISICLNTLLNKMSKITEEQFIQLYNNYRKINLLHSLYNEQPSASEISNIVVENLMKGDKSLCIVRSFIVPEYQNSIYTKFIKKLDNIEIKMSTNIDIHKKQKFSISEHYKTEYYITKFNINTDIFNVKFVFENLILFPDFPIKIDTNIIPVNKKEIPKLIFYNNVRDVYLLEYNKYEKPMMNISVIRKNPKFINKNYNLIINIYKSLCMKILNYYLDTISNYKMYYSMNILEDNLVYNFSGFNYSIKKFINDIVNKTSFNAIVANVSSKKYFETIKKDIVEELVNLKYETPFSLCLKYFTIILSKDFMPTDAIKYINNLSYDMFLNELDNLLFFEKEYFVIIGNFKQCDDAFLCDDNVNKNTMELVELLTLNNLRYKTTETTILRSYTDTYQIENLEDTKYYGLNYVLSGNDINPKEINNCLLDCYLVKKYDLELFNDVIEKKQLIQIFKDKIIFGMIADLINEPLFDKVRTIDKLGYIVKSTLKYHTFNNIAMIFICYVIQSNYKIKDIYKSVDAFNTQFLKNLTTNKQKFEKLFDGLKKSKIMEFKKEPIDLSEESLIYISSIVNKYNSFRFRDINLEILKVITFNDLYQYAIELFTSVIKYNRYHILLNKDL